MKKLSPYEELDRAIFLAAQSHTNDFDRGGKPYILHPLHIMQQLLFDPQLAAIGVLHDTPEDDEDVILFGKGDEVIISLEEEGFSDRVLTALDLLTHKPEDDYLEVYIQGICTNIDAIRVKRKDLEHNSSITRLKGFRQKDGERVAKYHKAFTILGEARKNFR